MNKIYKIYKILILGLVLSLLIQTASAANNQDYTCVDKVATESSPSKPLFVTTDNIEKTPLCSAGRVPKAVIGDTIQDKTIMGDIMQDINRSGGSPTVASCSNGKCYDWAYSIQFVDNKGIFAYITQHNPQIDLVNGIYSLARIHIGGGTNSENRVEFGWRKGNGDVTRLYTGWWKYNVAQCYNFQCGWIQTSNYYYPGMAISTDGYAKAYEIQYSNGNWWVYWNGEWLGYYPGSLWNWEFDQADTIMYSGGVISYIPITTTDMGNGLWSSNPSSARIDSQEYEDLNGYWQDSYTLKGATSSNLYSVLVTSFNSMRYGGPGSGGPSITVNIPNGGEKWVIGTTKTITWSYIGNPGSDVRIELLKGGILNRIITWSTPNDRSYSWAIPSTQILGIDYKIRITSTSNFAYKDASDNYFTIISPYITVLSPNGGENWGRGTTHTINWKKDGNIGSYVKIQLYKGGIIKSTINSYTPNDGSYSWTIPWSLLSGSDYKIKIASTSNSTYYDWSNNYFRIY